MSFTQDPDMTRHVERILNDPEYRERWFKTLAKTVAVDFDGVLHPYTDGWTGFTPADEPPMPGAREFLQHLVDQDYLVVVFSTRCESEGGLAGTTAWLAKHDLLKFVIKVTHEKPAAVAYVDDRAVPYRGDFDACLAGVAELAAGRAHGAAPIAGAKLRAENGRLRAIIAAHDANRELGRCDGLLLPAKIGQQIDLGRRGADQEVADGDR